MDVTGLKRPVVRLVGEDGNAFAILGRVRRAMRVAGWPQEKVQEFLREATAGDYDHLLQTVIGCCDEPFDGDEDAATH